MDQTPAVSLSFLQDKTIAVVRMQRGENRINADFVQDFNDCLDEIERTESCKGVVTTGEGKFYSNGLDLEWMKTVNDDIIRNFFIAYLKLLSRLLTFPLPTVAAINGHCYAGGGLIAFANDLRVMNSQRGWLCFNEVFINRRFGAFTLKYLAPKISSGRTFNYMFVFGKRFTGPEAEREGLVDKTVAPSLVLTESQRLLQSVTPKDGFLRESLYNMKIDVYADALQELNQSKL